MEEETEGQRCPRFIWNSRKAHIVKYYAFVIKVDSRTFHLLPKTNDKAQTSP